MSPKSIILPLGLLALTTGCPGSAEVCTNDARSAISLTVVDEFGAPIVDTTAIYTVDGGDEQDCDGADGDYTCGWEMEGEFEVTVDAPGFQAYTFTQEVFSDECHVLTEVVEHTLFPLACTDQEVPSIEVTVTDSQGADVTTGDVVWNMAAEDDLPEACFNMGGNMWSCGYETEGELIVEISNAGPYEDYAQIVTVGADECHVITEQLDAVLNYLPD